MPPNNPMCGVVIEKVGDQEKVCTNPAASTIFIANPDDTSQILAIVVLCKKHEQDLDSGKSLAFVGEGGYHIAVQYEQEQSHDAEHATQPG